MKFTLKTAIIGIAVVIVIVLYSALYTVEEGQQAIVVQFGRPVGEPVIEAGLHIKLPFVQEVRRFEKRLLVWDGDPNQIPTKGREFIWVDTTARWRIADAKKFLENVASEAGAQNRLNDIIDSVVRDQVSSSELVELVRSASWEIPRDEALKDIPKEREEALKKEIARGREEITRTILTEAQKIIPQYGIELVDVRIKRLDYVESVREKVYERMISERKRIAAQFRSEGEGRSAEILGTMEKALRQIRSTAYRRVQEIQGQADADATRVYGKAYNQNPEFYAFLRTLESYKENTNKNSVMILTTDSDFYQYIKQAIPVEAQGSRLTRNCAKRRKRWGLKRSLRENDGVDCEKIPRLEDSIHWQAKTHREGNMMPKNLESKDIEQLLTEADELIQQINSDAIKDMQEEHLLQFEIHAQNLKKIKSELQDKIEKKGTSELSSSAEGMHEAIQDIVKAMQGLIKYIS